MIRFLIILILLPATCNAQRTVQRYTNSLNPSKKVYGNNIAPKDTVYFYWLWGQSNALGRADTSQLSTEYKYLSELDTLKRIALANGTNNTNYLPDYYKIFRLGGTGVNAGDMGPAASLLDTLRKVNNDSVFLLKTTIGATSLAVDWDTATTRTHSLIQAYWRTRDYFLATNRIPICKGFITMQGESDALDSLYANAYASNFAGWIDFIRDLTNQPNLPFIVGKMSETCTCPSESVAKEIVANAQRAVCRYEIDPAGNTSDTAYTREYTWLIDTDDYTSFDGIHYDADSYVLFGWDIFRAMTIAGIH